VRAESDLQGHHRSEAPVCHRCGLPLLADAEYCPFCERWLDESRIGRLIHRHGAGADSGGVAARRTERVLLLIGFGVFAIVAVASIVFALTT
jgi:hypothetical protein